MNSPAPPPPPAEAMLIKVAREAAGLSAETAAARMTAANIGGSRWRQIEAGFRKDSRRPVTAKGPVLAHMALAVGVTADRLAIVGREDAAAILREYELKVGKRQPERPQESGSTTTRVDERWQMLEGFLRVVRQDLTQSEYRELVHRLDDKLQRDPDWEPPVAGYTDGGQQASSGA